VGGRLFDGADNPGLLELTGLTLCQLLDQILGLKTSKYPIESGSGRQTGYQNMLYRYYVSFNDIFSVLRIRDVYPGSRILIFTHPGSRIQKQQQKRGVKKICCQDF
jgi:hypothetical protein